MKNTALITFHAPYNYGSCLQAYALQRTIEKLGYKNEIINYRFKGQKDCYRLVRRTTDVKDIIKDLLQIPVFPKKHKRQELFESFIKSYLKCTKEFNEPEELSDLSERYDLYVSGSDQIWNKHSNELHFQDWKYMEPYLLNFTNKKKISYASSVGGTTDEEILGHMKNWIDSFLYVSAREESVAERLSVLLGRNVECVVDPTLLISKDEYIEDFAIPTRTDQHPYIFYYSLSGINTVRKHLNSIKRITKDTDYRVFVNSPYAYIPCVGKFKNIVDIGPIQFLDYIINADFVITDSFHGTAFSLNFEKPFYSLCKPNGGSEYRKEELVKKIGCDETLIYDINRIDGLNKIKYTTTILEMKRRLIDESKDRLNYALQL